MDIVIGPRDGISYKAEQGSVVTLCLRHFISGVTAMGLGMIDPGHLMKWLPLAHTISRVGRYLKN